MYSKKRNVLVVAAHPDDEILGCGGTMAKMSKAGWNVSVVILGEGITSRYPDRNSEKAKKELSKLKSDLKKASDAVGVKKVFLMDCPDNSFDTVPFLTIVKMIEKIKKEIDPKVVFTHNGSDLNIDHKITYRAVMTAFRPLPRETVERIYSFEVLSSTEWNPGNTFIPNLFVDISATLKNKLKAMSAYKGELKQWPHPRSLKAIEVLAMKRGCEVGSQACEAFKLVRGIERNEK